MATPQAAGPITARMTLWRVFGLSDNFSDRPQPYWSVTAPRSAGNSDELTVMIGDIPNELLIALKEWRAQTRGNLNLMVGHPMTHEERLAMYREDLETAPLREFDDPYAGWLTLRVSRTVELSSPTESELDWIGDAGVAIGAMQSFAAEGGQFLDCAVASVLGAAEGLNVRHLRFADRRPYLVAEGKAAVTIPKTEMRIKDSGISVGRNDGWQAAPAEQLTAAINDMPASSRDYKLIGQPASWLCAALGEEEDDLRRFTFAFAGLELLATQAEKAARDNLIDKIKAADNRLPVVELLWPSTSADFVWRNLVFRFAAMAAVYSPDTANDDIRSFKEVARARNDMFHGSDQTITRAISVTCQTLLQRYLGHVARGLQ